MIHNLSAYIKTKVPTAVLVNVAYTAASPDECILITDNGGPVAHDIDRTDHAVQLIARYNSVTQAKIKIDQVYAVLKNIFRAVLPAVTVDGVTYLAITAWQISPMQAPSYIGTDDGGRHLYSVNFLVTI